MFATVHADRAAILWRRDGTRLAVLGGPTDPIDGLCWDPRGDLLATVQAHAGALGRSTLALRPAHDDMVLARAAQLAPGAFRDADLLAR